MNFDTLLQNLENSGTEKTAAATQVGDNPNTALQAALKMTLEKTASAPSASNPIDDLEKLAEEIAGTEKEAEIIHAANMGRAFADAAIEEFTVAEAKVAQMEARVPAASSYANAPLSADNENTLKLAAEQGYADAQEAIAETIFAEKLANASPWEQDELIKVAQEAGRDDLLDTVAYNTGRRDIQEKVAAAQYTRGETDALQEVHDVAASEFLKGAQEANILINQARQS